MSFTTKRELLGKRGFGQCIAVDFDGVLHMYTSPWTNAHTIDDAPVPGAIEWLHKMVQDFDVKIFSSRCKTWRGRRAIRAWLKYNAGMLWYEGMGTEGLETIEIVKDKPPAMLIIDDRAWRFTGDNYPSVEDIYAAKPWNKMENKL